jgi:hypothetical protein
MPLLSIEAVYMDSNLKNSTYDGKEKTAVYIDVYQPESPDNEKSLQIKCDDVTIFNKLKKEFAMGSKFLAQVSVTAYKNKAYYKLIKLV